MDTPATPTVASEPDHEQACSCAAHRAEMDARPLMTAPEVVDYLRLPSVPALYTMRTRGSLPPAIKVQRQLLWRRADIDAWVATRVEA